MSQTGRSRRLSNGAVAGLCLAVVGAMTALGLGAAPLYRAFCNLTGFDGTVRRAEAAPNQILDRTVLVRFDANTRGDLPWTFTAMQTRQEVRIGETRLAHFTVRNDSDRPVSGQATFNVLPETAGAHFRKLQCFCFEEQTLQPGESMDFAVVYFVDPKFASDPETRRFQELTLSYSFFPSRNGDIQTAAADAATAPLGEGPKAGL